MKRRWRHLGLAVGLGGLLAAAAWVFLGGVFEEIARPIPGPDSMAAAGRPPRIRPDLEQAVIPPNIAPLNFLLEEPLSRYRVTVRSDRGEAMVITGRSPAVVIPPGRWKALLEANRGREFHLDVCARGPEGRWTRFETVTGTIARDPIDGYLVYRRMKPLYNKYKNVGIYQRDLGGYAETVVVHGRMFDNGCVNCHTFLNHETDRMLLHIRGPKGPALVLARGGSLAKVDTRTRFNPSPAGYSSWHPSGRLLAFSANRLSLFFHTAGETRDVFDDQSDLGVYWVDTNTVSTAPGISRPDRLETWPAWAPDGRRLYFSSAAPLPKERYRDVRYDLVRIPFDLPSRTWGEAETVLAAKDTALSITEPRVSPDGRWLLFCMSEYGNFPIYQPSSDLYLMDLKTRRYERLACNSDRCDSYHSWSSNSRWIVFSSKRMDGLLARPFFSYIDEGGKAHKPFPLPQEAPAFYDSFLDTFNAPELVREPVRVPAPEWARVISDPTAAENLKANLDPKVPHEAGAPEPAAPLPGVYSGG